MIIRKFTKQTKYLRTVFTLVLTGIATGIVIGLFKEAIHFLSKHVMEILRKSSGNLLYSVLIVVAFILLGTFIYFISKKDPNINGSGIPVIYGMIDDKIEVNSPKTLINKFITSTLTIGSGLTLGREGPSVQIAGLIGDISHKLSESKENKRYFIGSSAGAGIAVAFNAPMAGLLFTIEEIFKKTNRKVFVFSTLTVFSAVVTADLCFGNRPALIDIPNFEVMDISMLGLIIILGIFAGLSGVLFNYVVISSKKVFAKIKIHPYIKYLTPFVITALVLLLDIELFSSSEPFIFLPITGNKQLAEIIILYFLKILLLACAFGVGVPGGSLVPLLVIGSLLGNIVATSFVMLGLLDASYILAFTMLAMCGHFSAIVRTPITAIILILEMTGGAFNYLLGLAVVSLVAYSVAEVCKSKPFYDKLYGILLKNKS